MKKRLMSLLLTAAMVMSMIVVPAAAEDAPIKLSVNTTPASAQPGEIIDVAISLEDTEAERMYTALEFKLSFDPEVLSPVNQASRPPKQYAVLGSWAGQDASFSQNYPSGTNYISVAIGHGYGVVGTGDIVTMKFEVLKDVSKADSALDLDVTYAAYAVYDDDFNLLDTVDIVKNGELSVTDGSVSVIYPINVTAGIEQTSATQAVLSASAAPIEGTDVTVDGDVTIAWGTTTDMTNTAAPGASIEVDAGSTVYYQASCVGTDGVTYRSARQDFTMTLPTPASMSITTAPEEDIYVQLDEQTYNFAVTVMDGFQIPSVYAHDPELVTWSLDGEYAGVSMDKGVLKVTNEAQTCNVTVKAVYAEGNNTLDASKTVKIIRDTVVNSISILDAEGEAVTALDIPRLTADAEQDTVVNFSVDVKDNFGGDLKNDAVITWNVSEFAGVSIDNGVLTVNKNAKGGEFTVTATAEYPTGKTAVDTVTVTVTEEERTTASISITAGPTEGDIFAAGPNLLENYIAKAVDQYGDPVYDITWSLVDANGDPFPTDAASINVVGNGTSTIQINEAIHDTVVYVVATAYGVSSEGYKVTLTRVPAQAIGVSILNADNTVVEECVDVIRPAKGEDAASVTFKYMVGTDFGDEEYEGWEIDWTVTGTEKGVSITDGVLTVPFEADMEEVTVTAAVKGTDVSASIPVHIKKADSVATSIEMPADATMSIPTGDEANSKQFAAIVKDQYDEVMPEAEVTYTFSDADDFVSAEGNTVTVKKGATPDKAYTLTATVNDTELNDPMTITVVDIDIDWVSVNAQANSNAVYGQTWGQIVTFVNGNFASLDGVKVPGKFTLVDADKFPDAGEQQFVIRFESTDGQYVVDNTYSATIAPKSINLSWTGYTGLVYSGEAVSVTASPVGVLTGDTVELTYTDNNKIDAGDYTAKAATTNANYVLSNSEQTYTIAKADLGYSAPAEMSISEYKAQNIGNEALREVFAPQVEATFGDDDQIVTGTVAFAEDTNISTLSAGDTATIQYTFTPDSGNFNGFSGSFELTVTAGETQYLSFPSDLLSVTYGSDSVNNAATVTEGGNGKITYTSDDENVATVDENGVVTFHNTGSAFITATIEASFYNNIAWAESEASYTVSVDPATLTIDSATVGAIEKTYDGSNNIDDAETIAAILANAELQGFVKDADKDNVALDLEYAYIGFFDAEGETASNAGEWNTVFEIPGLTGDAAENYQLAETLAGPTGKIVTADPSITLSNLTQYVGNVTAVTATIEPYSKNVEVIIEYLIPAVEGVECDHEPTEEEPECDHTDGCAYVEAKDAYWTTDIANLPEGAGEYTVRAYTNGDQNLNAISVENAVTDTLKISAYSGGGGGGSVTLPVSVSKTENGSVSLSNKYATKGKEVTINVKPDDGYELKSITVTDAKGNEIEVVEKNGKYVFEMPATKVTVAAEFVEVSKECPSDKFTDLADDTWYHDAVDFVINKGMMSGVSADKFAPDMNLTRGMIVQILWAMEGKPVVNYAMSFQDVAADAWYAEAVRWAAAEGVASGYSAEKFGPNDSVTREQLAVMLYGYARNNGLDLSVGENTNILSYNDALSISEWAIPAMQWACGEGLISGTPAGDLMPTAVASRAQVAVILNNFYDLING